LQREFQIELREQQFLRFVRRGVSLKDQGATVGGRKMHIEHLNGLQLFENGARGQAGGLVPKEVRLCAAQVKGEVSAIYSTSLDEGVLHAGLEWRKVVDMAGAGEATAIHGVGDGAPWIAAEFDRQFGTAGHYLIDFYHVSEYLAQAAALASPQAPDLWRHNQQELLKAGQLDKVLANLDALPQEHDAVRKAAAYLREREGHLDYRSALTFLLSLRCYRSCFA